MEQWQLAGFMSRRSRVRVPLPRFMADDLTSTIQDNAAGPKRATGDSGSVEQHALKDQIDADRYLESKKATRKKGLGVKLVKLTPSGTV